MRTLEGPIITIGSDDGCTLPLSDDAAAPEQAVLIDERGSWLLINKADGSALNDEPLAREARRSLSDGDEFQVGAHVISFLFDDADAAGRARPDEPEAGPRPDARPPESRPPQPPTQKAPQRNFAKILESLRTVEDSFYFEVEGGAPPGRRVVVETAIMPLGWDAAGREISFDPKTITAPCAVVRKDWSGVFIQPLGTAAVAVNDETLASERRLREGDRLRLAAHGSAELRREPSLVFREPASLAFLDSIYQHGAQAGAGERGAAAGAGDVATGAAIAQPRPPLYAKLLAPGRKLFGYYTPLDLAVMCVATLVIAVIAFLVLLYFMPVR